MFTLPQALRRLKSNLTDTVPDRLVERLCADLELRFRKRALTPLVTAHLFLRQVLQGNIAVAGLQRRTKLDFTEAAYCQARQRLPVRFFRRLQQAVTGRCRADEEPLPNERWCGHRTFLLDGSSFSMPDTPELQETFGQPAGQAPGCGFPTAHLLTLFDAQRGYLLRALPSPGNTHDMSRAAFMHQELRPGDVLVGDRALCSYAHLALCRQRGLHGLFRAHQRLIIDFRPHRRHIHPDAPARGQAGVPRSRWLRRLGRGDQVVEYFKPKDKPDWMNAQAYAQLPASILVREVRVPVRQPGRRPREIILVTTLLDGRRYPARALARLYEARWQAEVNLRDLKQTLGLDVLRCETVPGVVKELLVFVTVYNLVRRVMCEAARRQQVLPNRISFVDALRWLQEASCGEALPKLRVNAQRPGRTEPRVRKRRPKQFPLMKRPREELRQIARRRGKAA
jgi:hypothetical protein